MTSHQLVSVNDKIDIVRKHCISAPSTEFKVNLTKYGIYAVFVCELIFVIRAAATFSNSLSTNHCAIC